MPRRRWVLTTHRSCRCPRQEAWWSRLSWETSSLGLAHKFPWPWLQPPHTCMLVTLHLVTPSKFSTFLCDSTRFLGPVLIPVHSDNEPLLSQKQLGTPLKPA